MTIFDDVARLYKEAGGDIKTRSELEHLRAQRRKALVTLVLTPNGVQADSSLKDRHREDRIRQIADALERGHGRAVTDFSLATLRGKARTDFDRER